MAQKHQIGDAVVVRYDGRLYKGIVKGYKIEDVGGTIVELYKVEYINEYSHKTTTDDFLPHIVFGNEIEAVNNLLDSYNVSEYLRFPKNR